MAISNADYEALKYRPYRAGSMWLASGRTEITISRLTGRTRPDGRPLLAVHCTLRYPTPKMARDVADLLPLGPDYHQVTLTTYGPPDGWRGQPAGSRDSDGNWTGTREQGSGPERAASAEASR